MDVEMGVVLEILLAFSWVLLLVCELVEMLEMLWVFLLVSLLDDVLEHQLEIV